MAGFFTLVGPAVAAMAITMQANDDPNTATANVVVMSLAGLVLTGLGIAVYRPLFTGTRPLRPTGSRDRRGTFVPSRYRRSALIDTWRRR